MVPRRSAFRRFLPFLAAAAGLSPLRAQTATWTGAVNNNWGVPGNWTAPPAFNGADALVLDTLKQPSQTLSGDRNINSLNFKRGGFSVANNNLSLNNSGAGIFSTGSNTVASAVYSLAPTTFRSEAGTLTLSGLITANSAYPPTAPAAPTLTGAGDFIVSGSVQGAGALTMSGTGSLLLSGTNYFTGATTVNSGTLKLGGSQLSQNAGALILNAGGTLDLNGHDATIPYLNGGGTVLLGANTLTLTSNSVFGGPNFAGAISGVGGVVIQNSVQSVLTLSGTSTFLGGVTVKQGYLNFANDASLGAAGGALTLDGGGLQPDKAVTLSRPLTIGAAGAHLVAASGTTSYLPLSVTGSGDLIFDGNTSTQGAWAGTGSYSFVGTTRLLNGSYIITSGAQLGAAGNAVYAAGGALRLQGGVTIAGRALTLSGNGYVSYYVNAALVSETGDNVWSNPVTLGNDSQIVTLSGATLALPGAFTGSHTLSIGGAGDTTITGALTGIGISKGDAGTLTLSRADSGAFSAAIYGGTLAVAGGDAIADSASVIMPTQAATFKLLASESINSLDDYGLAGATIDLGASDLTLLNSGSISGHVVGAGRLFKKGSGTLTLSGANTFTGGLYLDAGVTNVTSDAGFGAASNPVYLRGGQLHLEATAYQAGTHPFVVTAGDLNLSVTTAGDVNTVTRTLDQGGGLVKSGAGTLILAGAGNSYTGDTSLVAGTLSVASDNLLGHAGGAVNFNGGTLQITGTAFHSTARPLSGAGGYVALDIADPANVFTLSQPITSNGGVIKRGAGTLALAGPIAIPEAYVNAGTLRLDAKGGLTSAGSVYVSGGGLFDLNGIDQSTRLLFVYDATVETRGSLLTVTGQLYENALSGTVRGRVDLGGQNVNFWVDGATGVLDVNAVVSGGSITKRGVGLLILSGADIYTGSTTVSTGTLRLTGTINNNSAVQIAAGAALEIGDAGRLNVGAITNYGWVRLIGNAAAPVAGTFTNYGVLDLSRWNGTALPANFVNATGGIILTADDIRPVQTALSGGAFQLTVNAQPGLTYQLQRSFALAPAAWQNVSGQAQTPKAAGSITFVDSAPPASGSVFYRAVISVANSQSGH